jgi:hypothetical protein
MVAAWKDFRSFRRDQVEHALGRLGGGPPLITRALRRSSPLAIRAAPS